MWAKGTTTEGTESRKRLLKIEDSSTSDKSVEQMSFLEIFWTIAFSLIVITSAIGNCIVLWIVCGKIIHLSFSSKKQKKQLCM